MKKMNSLDVLVFQKAAITELNDSTLGLINGGTSDQSGIVDTCTISIICQTKDWF